MARPLRVQYPNAVYHVTCRGNEQKPIFRDDIDRKTLLKKLVQSMDIYTVKLYSYVLMNNHFHLLLETPLGNLGEFMRRFNISYTGYFNYRHKRSGHLFQGRYKSILVDKESYLSILSRYIHLNPVRTEGFGYLDFNRFYDLTLLLHLSTVPGFVPEATACPGREIHSLLAGMSPPIQLLNVSNLSHGGATHIFPTYPAPYLSDRYAQGSLSLEERFT